MMYRRYVIVEDVDGWRIWDDRDGAWMGKYAEPDPSYRATTREVAEMRVRDIRLIHEVWQACGGPQ
jgi:hypothetical protein